MKHKIIHSPMVKHTPLQEQVLSAHVINSSSTYRNHVFLEMQPGVSVMCSKQKQTADRKNTEWTRGGLLLTLQQTYEGESSPVNTSLHHVKSNIKQKCSGLHFVGFEINLCKPRFVS